jgi:hypothetical protein
MNGCISLLASHLAGMASSKIDKLFEERLLG